jgi:hypothetical protein
MPSLRSVLKPAPAAAIAAAALVFAAGTGSGSAATSANSASATRAVHPAGTTLRWWYSLPLGKGWHGSLKYAVSNGVVYLSGSAGKSGQTSVMTTLPAGARPSSQQDIPAATSNAVVGVIQLLKDGTIMPFDTTHDYTFVSLSGVSFGLGS